MWVESFALKLRDPGDQISFRVNALEGLGVAGTEYAVVLHRVLMKVVPSDLSIVYQQSIKESSSAAASDETVSSSEKERQVRDILHFLRI